MVCRRVIPEAKIWWQPCLGIEYAWSQGDDWTYTQGVQLFCFWGGGWGGVKMEIFFSCVPIMFSYVGSKNIILGKAYWTKWGAIRNIWGIPWELGEHVYHSVNWEQMRTSCEHIENKIIPKIQTPTPTNPKRIKTGIFGACSDSSLAEQKFQLCSSPILA